MGWEIQERSAHPLLEERAWGASGGRSWAIGPWVRSCVAVACLADEASEAPSEAPSGDPLEEPSEAPLGDPSEEPWKGPSEYA